MERVPPPGVAFTSPSRTTILEIQTAPTFTMGAGGLGGIYPNPETFGLREMQAEEDGQLLRSGELDDGNAFIAMYRYIVVCVCVYGA